MDTTVADMPSSEVSPISDDGGITIDRIVIGVVLLIITTITIVGNTVVLVAFAMERKLRNTFTYYIANLAVTDLLVGATGMLFYAFDTMLGYWPFGEFMCGVWIFCDYGMTFASVFMLVAISLDRLWAVSWAVHYRLHNTNKKSAFVIFLVWFLVLAIWLAPFILDRIKWSEPMVCIWEPSRNEEYIIFIAVVGHHAPCAILVFCYIRVFQLTKMRMKVAPSRRGRSNAGKSEGTKHDDSAVGTMSAFATASSLGENNSVTQETNTLAPPGEQERTERAAKAKVPKSKTSDQSEGKIFVTLSYIIFTYLICWVPVHVLIDLKTVNSNLVPDKIYTMGFWLAYVNSTLNPILYAYSNRDFRAAFIKVITCQYWCRK